MPFPASLTAKAVSGDGKAASCRVECDAAGQYLITATATVETTATPPEATQTLIVQALVEAASAGADADTGYATPGDMQTRFGSDEIARLDDAAGTRIARALTDASTEMDSYLGARYTLPLDADTAASPILKRICCDLARIYCYDDVAPERAEAAAKDARKTLSEISRGTMVLPGADGAVEAAVSGPQLAQRAGPDPVFTRDNLRGL